MTYALSFFILEPVVGFQPSILTSFTVLLVDPSEILNGVVRVLVITLLFVNACNSNGQVNLPFVKTMPKVDRSDRMLMQPVQHGHHGRECVTSHNIYRLLQQFIAGV